jgi:uncharacterized cofD-like protein
MTAKAPHIVVIGGGTGSFTLLQALKQATPNITAIVNMSDDGGSTGKLRDELGVLPPGDIRQCLMALSALPEVRELFNYRFSGETLGGQSLGNFILSGLELQYKGDFEKAVDVAGRMLNITGQVIPVTLTKHTLVLHDGDNTVKGQYRIEQTTIQSPDPRITHEPKASINPRAAAAIQAADLIVIAPGNLYCSLLPALAVADMREALNSSQAKVVAVANLVNKAGQTDNWHVVDYAKAIERYIGEDSIDYILYNDDMPSEDLLQRYAQEGEYPLSTSADRFGEIHAAAIGAHLIAHQVQAQDSNDTLIRRTLIRHDAQQASDHLFRILNQ